MKFLRFLKVFSIAVAGLIGTIGAVVGTFAVFKLGSFSGNDIVAENISLDIYGENTISTDGEFFVDGNFFGVINTTTVDVEKKSVTLSFSTSIETTKHNGRISDGVISVPENVKIGTPFEIIVETYYDNLVQDYWIKGGISTIYATYNHSTTNSTRAEAKVYVDCPVYSASVKLFDQDVLMADDSVESISTFIKNSYIHASLSFYPADSAFSFGRKVVGSEVYKNCYYTVENSSNSILEQVDFGNTFYATNIGEDNIISYVYESALTDYEAHNKFENDDLDEETYHARFIQQISASKESKSGKSGVVIENYKVDSIQSVNQITIGLNKKTTLFAYNNKISNDNSAQEKNLDITLKSIQSDDVSLQAELVNVAIAFIIDGHDATANEIDITGYDSFVEIDNIKYYYASKTTLVEDYNWIVSANAEIEHGDCELIIVHFNKDNGEQTERKIWVDTSAIISNKIEFTDTSVENLTIYDGDVVSFMDYDLSTVISVPAINTYRTVKYFVFNPVIPNDVTLDLPELIECKEASTYVLNGQSYNLYELEDGILKAKSLEAYGLQVSTVFLTVVTDGTGNPVIIDGLYKVDKYSSDEYNAVSLKNFTFTKTLKEINASVEIINTIKMHHDDKDVDNQSISFVQNTENAFAITISAKQGDNKEQSILDAAMQEGDISFVLKDITGKELSYEYLTFSSAVRNSDGSYLASVSVNSLGKGNIDVQFMLFVKYQMSKNVVSSNQCINDYAYSYVDNLGVSVDVNVKNLEFLEIFSAKPVNLGFYVNMAQDVDGETIINPNGGDFKTSAENPVVVSTAIDTTATPFEIVSSYKYNDEDIDQYLFNANVDDGSFDYTSININFADKYGNTPVDDGYSLESNNASVMAVTGDFVTGFSVTFAGEGEAELSLVYKGVVVDILYFACEQGVHIDKVTSIVQTIESANTANITINSIFEDEYSTYDFAAFTVDVYGYQGLALDFKDNSQKINFIDYFILEGLEYVSLSKFIEFEIVNENTSDFDYMFSYYGSDGTKKENYADVEGLRKIVFDDHFGVNVQLNVKASIPSLGISQIITLNILPNVTVNLYQTRTAAESAFVGGTEYLGAYTSSDYTINFVVSYVVVPDSLTKIKFELKAFDVLGNNVVLKNEADESASILLVDNSNINIKFPDIFDNQSQIVIYTQKKDVTHNYGASSYIYVNIVKNAEIDQSSYNQTAVLDSVNQVVVFGVANDGLVKLKRISGNKDFNFGIDDVELVLTSEIGALSVLNGIWTYTNNSIVTEPYGIVVEVSYGGILLGEVAITIAPDIMADINNSLWQLYNEKHYFMLVGEEIYSSDILLEAFASTNGNITSLEIYDGEKTVENINSSFGNYEAPSCYGVFAFADTLGKELYVKVTDSSGNTMTYPVMIAPSRNYANYDRVDCTDDLAKLLDEDYLLANGYANEFTAGEYQLVVEDLTALNVYGIDDFVCGYSSAIFEIVDIYGNAAAFANINKSGLLTVGNVGTDYLYIVRITLDAGLSNTIVIPYIINITASVKSEVYYPYGNSAASIIKIENEEFYNADVNFNAEYLTFENSSVSINFDESTSAYPNIVSDYKRVNVVATDPNVDAADRIHNEIISYSVTNLIFRSNSSSFSSPVDFATYASFDNSVLTINSNGANIVRVEVKFTTQSGISGYYYICVGEIPVFTLYNNKDVYNGSNIEIVGGETYDLSNFELKQSNGSIIYDRTSLLEFVITSANDENIIITQDENDADKNIISTQATVQAKEAQMVVYTKYGKLANVSILVKSSYFVNAYGFDDVFAGTSISFADVKDKITLTKETIEQTITAISVESQDDSIVSIIDNVLYFNLINESSQDVVLKISITIDGETETYVFDHTITINKSISNKYVNGNLNSEFYYVDATYVDEGIPQPYGTAVIHFNIDDIFDMDENVYDKDNNTLTDFALNGKTAFKFYSVTSGMESLTSVDFSSDNYGFEIELADIAVATNLYYKCDIVFNDTRVVMSAYFFVTTNTNFAIEKAAYPFDLASEYFYGGDTLDLFNTVSWYGSNTANRFAIFEKDGVTELADISNFTFDYQTASDVDREFVVEETEGTFTFDFTKTDFANVTVTFTLMYDVNSTESYNYKSTNYSYIVVVYEDMNDVFSVTTSNINNTEAAKTNSKDNAEFMYHADPDNNPKAAVKVYYTVNDEYVLDGSKEISNINIFGKNINDFSINITESMKGREYYFIAKIDSYNFDAQAFTYNVNGAQDTSKVSIIKDIRFELRYNISYQSNILDFVDQYNLISCVKNEIDITRPDEVIWSLNISDAWITNYYVKMTNDIDFETTVNENNKIELQTNQRTNLIAVNEDYDLDVANNLSLIKMKKISSGMYYQTSELGSESALYFAGVKIYEADEDGNYKYDENDEKIEQQKGYLQVTTIDDSDGNVIDYIFVAQGSPKDGITLKVVIELNIGTDGIQTQEFLFEILPDYLEPILYNENGTVNSDGSRLNVSENAGNIVLVNSINFSDPTNKVYIEHLNNKTGNVAQLFESIVLESSSGTSVVNQYLTINKTSTSLSLAINTTDFAFGSLDVVVVFTDAYGYTFNYYIYATADSTIKSTNQGYLSIYELDNIQIVTDKGTDSDTAYVTIAMEGTTTTFDAGSYLVKYYLLDANGDADKDAFTVNDEDGIAANTEQSLKMLDGTYFNAQGYFIGSLVIEISLDVNDPADEFVVGNIVTLNIPVQVFQRYTAKQIDGDTYVRDGVNFSVYDVVDVIDNKNSIVIGERSLTTIDAVYADVTYTNDIGDAVLTYVLKATHNTTNEVVMMFLEYKNHTIYANINEYIKNISAYSFEVGVYGIDNTYFPLKKEDDGTYKAEGVVVVDLAGDENDIKTTVTLSNYEFFKDQLLKFNSNSITEEKDIKLHFTNNKTINISLDTVSTLTFYLTQEGIIDKNQTVDFVYNIDADNAKKSVIKGLSIEDIQALKNVTVKEYFDENNHNYNDDEAVYIQSQTWSGNDCLTSIDGIPYQEKYVTYYLSYGEDNSTLFNATLRVTPKFIGIDTSAAYGAGTSKSVYVDESIIGEDKGVDLAAWAGTKTDENAFVLIPGISTATSFDMGSLYFTDNIDNLSLAINSQNGGSSLATIDRESGELKLLSGFNITNNYLDINVSVKAGSSDIKIQTIRLMFKKAQIETLEFNDTIFIKSVEQSGTTTYQLYKYDILNAIKAYDDNGKRIPSACLDIAIVVGETETNFADLATDFISNTSCEFTIKVNGTSYTNTYKNGTENTVSTTRYLDVYFVDNQPDLYIKSDYDVSNLIANGLIRFDDIYGNTNVIFEDGCVDFVETEASDNNVLYNTISFGTTSLKIFKVNENANKYVFDINTYCKADKVADDYVITAATLNALAPDDTCTVKLNGVALEKDASTLLYVNAKINTNIINTLTITSNGVETNYYFICYDNIKVLLNDRDVATTNPDICVYTRVYTRATSYTYDYIYLNICEQSTLS